jgi:hypothetical protein
MPRPTPTSDTGPGRQSEVEARADAAQAPANGGANLVRTRVPQPTVRWGNAGVSQVERPSPYAAGNAIAVRYDTELPKRAAENAWLSVAAAADFGIDACEGLVAVHGAGIVNRGLKPAKLFLTRKRSGSIRLKLADSEVLASTPLAGNERAVTSTHALMGSPVYMAPEQLHSTDKVDARAEIWSLGVLLYELLSGGQTPFDAASTPDVCRRILHETPESLSTLRPDLPLGLEAVVNRCLEKDPSRRFPSASSLAIALAPYASRRGQLCARHMQHPRSLGRPHPVQRPEADAGRLLQPPPGGPPMLTGISPQRGPTGTVMLRHAPPLAPRQPPAPVPLLEVRFLRRTRARMLWTAAGLSTIVALLVAAGLVGAMKSPATAAATVAAPEAPADPSTARAGIANHMPDPSTAEPAPMAPAASASAWVGPIATPQAPAAGDHIFAPEELPPASTPAARPARSALPRAATPRNAPSRSANEKRVTIGPDGF